MTSWYQMRDTFGGPYYARSGWTMKISAIIIAVSPKINIILLAGKSSAHKVSEIREKMEEKNASVLIVSALDEVACKFLLY